DGRRIVPAHHRKQVVAPREVDDLSVVGRGPLRHECAFTTYSLTHRSAIGGGRPDAAWLQTRLAAGAQSWDIASTSAVAPGCSSLFPASAGRAAGWVAMPTPGRWRGGCARAARAAAGVGAFPRSGAARRVRPRAGVRRLPGRAPRLASRLGPLPRPARPAAQELARLGSAVARSPAGGAVPGARRATRHHRGP